MTKTEKYNLYKKDYLNKHKSKHGLRSFESWTKKNKYKSKIKKTYALFAADFETTYQKSFSDEELIAENRGDTTIDLFADTKYSQVFLSGIWSLQTNEYKQCYENIAETLSSIASMCWKEHHRKCIVFYHNLAFDGSYILNWLQRHGYKQSLRTDEKTFQPIIGRKEYSLLMSGGKFFNMTIWWYGIKIMFVDSLKILPQSLGSLGETVGYKKLKEIVNYKDFKLDPKHNYPSDWLTYLKRDCEILAKVLQEFFKKEPLAIRSLTIGAISYKHIKPLVTTNVRQLNIEEFYFWNMWYRGGLCFPSITKQATWVLAPKQIKMIDATSMYPSQMIKNLPCGEASKEIDPRWKSYCCFYEIKIKHATIKKKYEDIAVIPRNYIWDNRKKKIKVIFNGEIKKSPYEYIQESEEAIYHVIDKELGIWEELYNLDYEILNTYFFETKPYLKEEVEKMFIEKQEASRHKQQTNKMIAKFKINNLYGKLGQKPNRDQTFFGKKEDIPDTYEIMSKKKLDIEAYNVQLKKDDSSKAQPVHIAAYVTMLARVELLKKYIYIINHGGKFLYCDTDSICFVDNKTKPIKFNDIGDNLGCWAFEENKETGGILIGDGFCSLCPKQYRIVQIKKDKPLKLASAGIDKVLMSNVSNQDYNFDLSSNTLYHITKKKLINSKYGKVIDENSPFSFKKWKKYFKSVKCPKVLYNKPNQIDKEGGE